MEGVEKEECLKIGDTEKEEYLKYKVDLKATEEILEDT